MLLKRFRLKSRVQKSVFDAHVICAYLGQIKDYGRQVDGEDFWTGAFNDGTVAIDCVEAPSSSYCRIVDLSSENQEQEQEVLLYSLSVPPYSATIRPEKPTVTLWYQPGRWAEHLSNLKAQADRKYQELCASGRIV